MGKESTPIEDPVKRVRTWFLNSTKTVKMALLMNQTFSPKYGNCALMTPSAFSLNSFSLTM